MQEQQLMREKQRQLKGACHCGNIRFVFATDKADTELPVRECQCRFCRQHGRISTSDPDGKMHVSIDKPENVNRYRFGHRTADFYICKHCGCIPVVTSDIDGTTVGLVDVRMIEGFVWSRDHTSHSHLSGESIEERLARRKRTWTGTVIID